MSGLEQSRWVALWESVNAIGEPELWYERLTAAYAEPWRHYHNDRHIAECLAEFDAARFLAREPAAVELALWFHDAVYDPKAADNEEQSAALAKRCLGEARIPQLAETVSRLVMATKEHTIDGDADAALVVDVDLSILGQGEERFSEYEEQIRREYAWVEEAVFASKRAEILERFLSRERIFVTDFFRAKYEANTLRNLQGSIRKWREFCR